MNNLKDIHNGVAFVKLKERVVLSGFQWTIWRIYTTELQNAISFNELFYQDFNEQFEGYTQLTFAWVVGYFSCFIRISMNNLKDIHNNCIILTKICYVVLSGFQWTIWRIYTTLRATVIKSSWLFYQDFNEQFEGYTQRMGRFLCLTDVVLSGFQWTIWRIYTTLRLV